MKFAWTARWCSTALQGPSRVQALPFRRAWTANPLPSALQGPSPVQAIFINASRLHPRLRSRHRRLPATHLHPDPRWSALQGLCPCKCVAVTPPRRHSARPCRYAFAPRPPLERAAEPPPLQMRSRHPAPAPLSAALPLRICTPPPAGARCRAPAPANA